MKVKNPFDLKIEVQKQMPASIRDAAIELTDTLDLCWAAAQAVFEGKAKPEHALELLPMFMERVDAKRLQQEREYHERTAAASRYIAARKRPRPEPPAT